MWNSRKGEAMRIKVIIPNASVPFRDSQVAERKKLASPGNTVEVDCLPHGPVSIESAYDEAIAGPYIIGEIRRAEAEGFNAVSLDCAMDTVVRASREAVGIPVVSAGEASYLVAMGICVKFSVVTVLKTTADAIRDNLRKYGFTDRVASVRYARIPVLELNDEEKAFRAISAEAEKALAEDGAECIVLGCTGMSTLAGRLMKHLGVPVVDAATAALKMAELYLAMGLTSSKIAFEAPSKKAVL
jgi:allantoin racemase